MKVGAAEILRHLSSLGRLPSTVSDKALLDCFVRQRDEQAFAALVARHGPMVLRVCRRVLANADDAEDVVQAVFLVLARKAGTIRRRDSLPSWLHGVAHRLALKARATIHRRQRLELRPGVANPATQLADPLANVSAREILTILDAELARLPAKYRGPLVLCCLEGRTLQEAAQQLGGSTGSVKGHLERGRRRLHARLLRRGVSLGAALAAAHFAGEPSAAMPTALATAVVRNGLLFVSQKEVVGISTAAAILAHGALKEMLMSKLKVVTAVFLAICVAVFAVSTWGRPAKAQGQPPQTVDDKRRGSDPKPGEPPSAANRPAPTGSENGRVSALVTLNGEHSKIIQEKLVRVTRADDWEALWNEHKYGSENSDKVNGGAEMLEVDFRQLMAITVFEGIGVQCRGYTADSTIESDDRITIRIKKLSYSVVGDPIVSEAWGIFVLPKSNKEVIVEVDVRSTNAEPAKWKEWKKFPALSEKP